VNGSGITNQQGFHGNYVLNGGSTYFNQGGAANSEKLNGLFFPFSRIGFADIRDGTSNTLMTSEILLVPDVTVGPLAEDVRGRYHNVRHAGALFSALYTPNTSQPDRFDYCISTSYAPCTPTSTDVVVSARSYHPGGVTMGTADGAVHFLADDIDATLFKALATRAGGEVLSSSW
jgi:hypothetical protein